MTEMEVADVENLLEPGFTLYRLHQSEAIFILDVVYITPLQTVRAARKESDSALMVIRKVIRYVPYREKPCVPYWKVSFPRAIYFTPPI